MIDALNIKNIETKVAEYPKDRMIGILFARYDTNLELIQPNYTFWNSITSNHFDIFLAGYGAYIQRDKQTSQKKIIDFLDENTNSIYFDNDAYISIINKLKKEVKSFKYDDSGPLLVLFDVKSGKIEWNNPLFIKMKLPSSDNYDYARALIYKLSELTTRFNSILDIWTELKIFEIRKKVTLSVSFSDILALFAFLKS